MMKAVATFIAMEVLVFLLAAAFYFVIGVSHSGIQEGFRMASGVLYSWFAFVVLGFIGWVVWMVALAFRGKGKQREQQK
jgi:hypothetical protein